MQLRVPASRWLRDVGGHTAGCRDGPGRILVISICFDSCLAGRVLQGGWGKRVRNKPGNLLPHSGAFAEMSQAFKYVCVQIK